VLTAWANAFAKGAMASGARQENLSTACPPNVTPHTTSLQTPAESCFWHKNDQTIFNTAFKDGCALSNQSG
jgi:hypothetical protein